MKEIAVNRKANFEYFIEETYECGIALAGQEVKSLRAGHLTISDNYAVIRNGEVFLINANIPCYEKTSAFKQDEKRSRKLLLHKSEIARLERKVQDKSFTLIPLKAYFKDGIVKVLLGLAKGKHLYEKKQSLKEKDISRETSRDIKNFK
ncbi:MAG: SsrA-binding protein SmpB [Clostridia bacterium]|nr:SsrA-binding protein SmpB [Clostridia bacterium]